ncbi:MAG: DMT family transporter [Gammaproteobacteria bacterium]|nr:MAG: DMT family transporter [Gammaproteobacteria bacterium]
MNRSVVVTAAFILVVLIWSTTPLAIKWSGEGVGFLFGVSLRMLIGAMLALFLTLMYYRRLPLHGKAIHVYFAAGSAIFGAMMAVYWGAQHISSGLISVVFGMTPMFTALLAARFLHEQSLTLFKLGGSVLGVAGLAIIFSEQLGLGQHAQWGITAVLVSVMLHSMSAVWIKYIDAKLPALVVTTGGLLFSLPLFILVWLLFPISIPELLPARTIWSIVYLGVMGSVVGFVCYYFLLENLHASTVALITLITPVVALLIGNTWNGETLTRSIWAGTGLVLLGLALHQWGSKLFRFLWQKNYS